MNGDLSYLDEILAAARPRLQETVFVNKYLPLLFHEDPKVFNFAWLNEVAKNPHAWVSIIDPTGKELFVVPPLRTPAESSVNYNVNRAMTHFQIEMDRNRLRGVLMMEKTLPLLIQLETHVSEEYKEEWRKILDRYNLSERYEKSAPQTQLALKSAHFVDSSDGWD